MVAQIRVQMPPGFRVLVVATRSTQHLENLLDAAHNLRTLSYFARLPELGGESNMLLDPVWRLPSGVVRAVVD